MKKKNIKARDGSALLIAVIIMLVTLMLGLALLLVSFSLFKTVNRQQALSQTRELAQTISRQLEAEITIATPESGKETDYPLWNYLRNNISVANNETLWPYYDAEKSGHKKANAYRYFDISGEDVDIDDTTLQKKAKDLLAETTVLMYWTSDSTEMSTETDDSLRTTGAVLTVTVTCGDGEEKTSVTNNYTLQIGDDSGTSDDSWLWIKQ